MGRDRCVPASAARARRCTRSDGRGLRRLLGADAPGDADNTRSPDDAELTGATLDSRAVRPGDLYAALPGARVHGARFTAEAAAAGAAAVLTDPEGLALREGTDLPVVVVDDPRGVLGRVSPPGSTATRLTTC